MESVEGSGNADIDFVKATLEAKRVRDAHIKKRKAAQLERKKTYTSYKALQAGCIEENHGKKKAREGAMMQMYFFSLCNCNDNSDLV